MLCTRVHFTLRLQTSKGVVDLPVLVVLSVSLALHTHSSDAIPLPAQAIDLVPRAAVPLAADFVKHGAQRRLQAEGDEHHDDDNDYKLDDMPNEGMRGRGREFCHVCV